MAAALRRLAWAAALAAVLHGSGERLAGRPADAPRGAGGAPRRPGRGLGRWTAILAAIGRARAQGDLREFFAGLDANSDGAVDLEEYLAAAEASIKHSDFDEAVVRRMRGRTLKLFALADADGDGRLTEAELGFLQSLDLYHARLEARLMAMHGSNMDGLLGDNELFGVEEPKALFREIDADSDGAVSKDEFMKIVAARADASRWTGFSDDSKITEWAEGIFARGDLDGDLSLNEREFHYSALLLDSEMMAGVFAERALASDILGNLDKDGDGKIDEKEVADALAAQGQGGPKTLLHRFRERFHEADADGDRALDCEETSTLAARLIAETTAEGEL